MDKKFTVRLNIDIYYNLKEKSDYLGLTLAGLLKYQLYELKNKDFPIKHFNTVDTVRMTLSLPIAFYEEIDTISNQHKISKNDFINSALFHYLNF